MNEEFKEINERIEFIKEHVDKEINRDKLVSIIEKILRKLEKLENEVDYLHKQNSIKKWQ